jgi:hypothetical protein
MPVHIEEMNVDMQVSDGELPLSEAQIERLIKLVLARLERNQRNKEGVREATSLRVQAAPQIHISE